MAKKKPQARHRLTIRDGISWEIVFQGVFLHDEIAQAVEDEIGLSDYEPKVGVTEVNDFRIQVSRPAFRNLLGPN